MIPSSSSLAEENSPEILEVMGGHYRKSHHRRKSSRGAASFLLSLLTLHHQTSVKRTAAFSPVTFRHRGATRSTELKYVQTPLEVEYDFASALVGVSADKKNSVVNLPLELQVIQEDDDAEHDLPPWLSPSGQLVHDSFSSLRQAMNHSNLTDEEAYTVMLALYSAGKNSLHYLSGAADFLTILVKDCDVGVDALVAAAFHYCSCVAATRRTSDASWKRYMDEEFPVCEDPEHMTLLPAGSLAHTVAQNAAQLKRTEFVASATIKDSSSIRTSKDGGQYAENFRNLLLAETTNWRALVIRCAASLYRLQSLVTHLRSSPTETRRLTPEYMAVAREAIDIYAPLASRLGMHRLKNEIEYSAFQLLYRRQYSKVMSLYHREEMEPIMQSIKSRVEQIIAEDPQLHEYASSIKVTARVKEPFSLWRKMLRSGAKHVHQVSDAIALRIIVEAKPETPDENIEVTRARERALCYYIQHKCMQEYPSAKTTKPRFKDYIAHPKKNGYQSLHYTAVARGSEPYLVEVQVRSEEMHRVAEYGIAAHWDYKLHGRNAAQTKKATSNDAYLKSVQAWQEKQKKDASSTPVAEKEEDAFFASERRAARSEHLKPYLEALKTTKFDLAREQVFVFLSPTGCSNSVSTRPNNSDALGGGQILSLPYGSCVLDALRAVEKQYGSHAVEVCGHNGSMISSVTQRLRNGDVLSVMA